MNRWMDDHPERANIRAPEQMLDGRINKYHPHTDRSDERYMGDGPAPRLTGTHGRADVNVGIGDWSDESSKPFRDLISNPHIVRWMLATIGDEFTWAGGHGLTQTKGSEGFILHGKGRYVRPREVKGFSRTPGSWYRASPGVIT